ncbi:12014_t:CDS:2, partial [Gigaspora margarita]
GSHLVPMLEICKVLVDRGYNVTLIAPGNFTAKSDLYNLIPQIIMDEEIDLYREFPSFENDIFEQKHFNVFHAFRSFSSSKYVKTYNTYKQAAEEINVDLFICDYFLNHAYYDIAWKLKKPAVGITSVMNFEKLEAYGMALRFMNNNLESNDVVSKVKRLINEESFKKNAESKRKYRGADLIEVMMKTIRSEGIKDENGSLMIDNNVLLKEWISPSYRMGFIRGSYLDVYIVAAITFLTLSSGFGYLLWKIIKFFL